MSQLEFIDRLKKALEKIEAEDREEFTNGLGPFARIAHAALGREPEGPTMKLRADLALDAMAATFRERNPMYGENWQTVGRVMTALYPDGITLKTQADFIKFHFFDWIIGKFTRYVRTDMTHKDSIHDAAVYMAMLAAFIDIEPEYDGVPRPNCDYPNCTCYAGVDMTGKIGVACPRPLDAALAEAPDAMSERLVPRFDSEPGSIANKHGDIWISPTQLCVHGQVTLTRAQATEARKYGWKEMVMAGGPDLIIVERTHATRPR